MTEIIAGVEIPETAAAAEATRLVRETTSPVIFHHSRRVFVFAALRARELRLAADPELLYIASLFHDVGLAKPFSDTKQRFEIDGADHARSFLLDHGFPDDAADVVWQAVALHTTPAIPARMGPVIAATNYGVLVDIFGLDFDRLDPDQVAEITAVHPRTQFKQQFLQSMADGLQDRPDTTHGSSTADVLEHFVPDFRRVTMVERIAGSPWAE